MKKLNLKNFIKKLNKRLLVKTILFSLIILSSQKTGVFALEEGLKSILLRNARKSAFLRQYEKYTKICNYLEVSFYGLNGINLFVNWGYRNYPNSPFFKKSKTNLFILNTLLCSSWVIFNDLAEKKYELLLTL